MNTLTGSQKKAEEIAALQSQWEQVITKKILELNNPEKQHHEQSSRVESFMQDILARIDTQGGGQQPLPQTWNLPIMEQLTLQQDNTISSCQWRSKSIA